jgi:hypothetical protein
MENVTLNQIAYSIFETVRGQINDDDNIAIEQIKDLVHSTRSRLLHQKFNKNIRVIEDSFTQSLGQLEIEAVDSSNHSTIKSGRYMYRTKKEIPATISRTNYEGTFLRIGPADELATEYNLVSYNRALHSGNGKFNKDVIFCFIRDSRIYLISSSGAYHKGVQFIDVIGVFDNPTQVAKFKDVNGSSLYSDDGRYPVSRALRDDIENLILKEKFGIKANAPSDKTNDGTMVLNG